MLESLSLINLFVRDVPTSRSFYCDLLGVPVVTPSDDQYTLLDIDGPQLYLHWTPPDTEVEYRQRGVELYFRVSDADQLAERLRAKGVAIREGPYDVGWRPWRCIQVEDPDGYVLFLASHTRNAANTGDEPQPTPCTMQKTHPATHTPNVGANGNTNG